MCVPAGDLLVESCRCDFVCVPAGNLLVESCSLKGPHATI